MNIEFIREICLGLPSVTEDIKWGHDLVFSVGDKMFCVVGLDQTPTTASFKVKDEEFDDMCSDKGYILAPYMARYKWVRLDDINRMPKNDWQHYLKQSYQLVFDKLPSKKKKQLQ